MSFIKTEVIAAEVIGDYQYYIVLCPGGGCETQQEEQLQIFMVQ